MLIEGWRLWPRPRPAAVKGFAAGVVRGENAVDTNSATVVNVEDCSGCGLDGWGWQDNGDGR